MMKDALFAGVNAAVLTPMRADLSVDLDRMAAHCALVQGLSLAAILPFETETYERDFTEETSRLDYRELIGKASADSTRVSQAYGDQRPSNSRKC